MRDLAVIIVSTNEGKWLTPCLRSVYQHAGPIDLEVVVADNESQDETRAVVAEFDSVRIVPCHNRGFAHANNRGLMTCDARFVLFLNPDTEILEGSLADLVAWLDRRPDVGLVGVRQVTSDGSLHPTIRRFPNAVRALGEAFASERLPFRHPSLGERELSEEAYEREVECDWTSGSFMLARREAIESGGFLDERFFIYSEETDFCYRIKQSGWRIYHLPTMTILHHARKIGINPRMEAQNAFSRIQYAAVHFSPAHRAVYRAAVMLRYGVRAVVPGGGEQGTLRRAAGRKAVRVLLRREPPPFGEPPPVAVQPRKHAARDESEARDALTSRT